MPKQFTLEQAFCQGRTIDRNERFVGALTIKMNCMCGELFASAAFAEDQDG